MSSKFDKALHGLKDTFPSPNPEREEEFLRSLPPMQQKEKKWSIPFLHTGGKPFWYAFPAVLAAAAVLTVGIGVYQRVGQHDIPTVGYLATSTSPAENGIFGSETVTETVRETVLAAETIPATETLPEQTETSIEPVQTSALAETMAEKAVTSGSSTAGQMHTAASQTSADNSHQTRENSVQTTARPSTEKAVSHITSQTTAELTTTAHPAATTRTAAQTTTQEAENHQTTMVMTTHAFMTTATTATTQREAMGDPETIPATEPPTEWEPIPDETVPPYETVPYEPTVPYETVEEPVATTNRDSADGDATAFADVVVTPSNTYTVTFPIVERITESDDNSSETPVSEALQWQSLFYSSEQVIEADVTEVIYTLVNGQPYTQLNLLITQSYRGNLRAGSRLSVYEQGGYMALADYLEQNAPVTEAYSRVLTDTQIQTASVDCRAAYPTGAGEHYIFFLRSGFLSGAPSGIYVYTGSAAHSRWTYGTNSLLTMDKKEVPLSEFFSLVTS